MATTAGKPRIMALVRWVAKSVRNESILRAKPAPNMVFQLSSLWPMSVRHGRARCSTGGSMQPVIRVAAAVTAACFEAPFVDDGSYAVEDVELVEL